MKTLKHSFLFACLLVSTQIYAAGVAVVDLEALLSESKTYLDAKTKLEAQVKREQSNLETMNKDIEALNSKLEKNRAAMTAEAIDAMQKDISSKQNAFATKQMSVQRELYKANQDALTAAFDQIRQAASKVGKQLELDVILPKMEAVYAQKDVTQEVKAALTK